MITTPHTRPFTYPIIQEYAALGLDPTKIEALYMFDPAGNLYDASGNQRHGDISVSSGFSGVGRYGTGMHFDGVDDIVRISNFVESGNSGAELSVFTWVNLTNGDATKIIAHDDTGVPSRSWYIDNGVLADNIFRVVMISGGVVKKQYKSVGNFWTGNYKYVGFTFDGNQKSLETPANDGRLIMYVNGVAISVTATTDLALSALDVSVADIILGASLNNDASNLESLQDMDNVLIYSGVLTPNQIQNLYKVGL